MGNTCTGSALYGDIYYQTHFCPFRLNAKTNICVGNLVILYEVVLLNQCLHAVAQPTTGRVRNHLPASGISVTMALFCMSPTLSSSVRVGKTTDMLIFSAEPWSLVAELAFKWKMKNLVMIPIVSKFLIVCRWFLFVFFISNYLSHYALY